MDFLGGPVERHSWDEKRCFEITMRNNYYNYQSYEFFLKYIIIIFFYLLLLLSLSLL